MALGVMSMASVASLGIHSKAQGESLSHAHFTGVSIMWAFLCVSRKGHAFFRGLGKGRLGQKRRTAHGSWQ